MIPIVVTSTVFEVTVRSAYLSVRWSTRDTPVRRCIDSLFRPLHTHPTVPSVPYTLAHSPFRPLHAHPHKHNTTSTLLAGRRIASLGMLMSIVLSSGTCWFSPPWLLTVDVAFAGQRQVWRPRLTKSFWQYSHFVASIVTLIHEIIIIQTATYFDNIINYTSAYSSFIPWLVRELNCLLQAERSETRPCRSYDNNNNRLTIITIIIIIIMRNLYCASKCRSKLREAGHWTSPSILLTIHNTYQS